MVKSAPDLPKTDKALDGIEAHNLACSMLRDYLDGYEWGDPEDTEIYGVALQYVEHCITAIDSASSTATVLVESELPNGYSEGDCRVDFAIIDHANNLVTVVDFKYGRSRVDAVQNWPLVAYTAALAKQYPGFRSDTNVQLQIVQPRLPRDVHEKDVWNTTMHELKPYIHTLEASARYIQQGRGQCRPGAYCRMCPARTVCAACIDYGLSILDTVSDATPINMGNDATLNLYKIVLEGSKVLDALKTGIEQVLESKLAKGVHIKGVELKRVNGRTSWVDVEQVKALSEIIGIKLTKEVPVPINEAVKAGVTDDVISAFTHRPQGALRLTLDAKTGIDVFGGKNSI